MNLTRVVACWRLQSDPLFYYLYYRYYNSSSVKLHSRATGWACSIHTAKNWANHWLQSRSGSVHHTLTDLPLFPDCSARMALGEPLAASSSVIDTMRVLLRSMEAASAAYSRFSSSTCASSGKLSWM